MLKKAAIIVVGSAAVILAASPLALADSFDHSPQCVSATQAADNSPAQAASATTPALGAAGILAAVNAAIPVNAQTQAPIASCNNIEDVLDLNVTRQRPGQQQEHRQEQDRQPRLVQHHRRPADPASG